MVIAAHISQLLWTWCFLLMWQCIKSTPLNLVATDGKYKPSFQVEKYLDEKTSQEAQSHSSVAIIDCASSSTECSLLNTLFDASFAPAVNQLFIEVVGGNQLLVRVCYDNHFETAVSGSKSVDYCLNLQVPIAFLLSSENIEDDLLANQQTFRRIFKKVAIEKESSLISPLLLIINSENDIDELKISETLQSTWEDVGGQGKVEESLPIKTVFLNALQVETLETSKNAIKAWIVSQSSSGPLEASATLSKKFSDAWTKLPAIPSKVLNKAEQQSLFIIEKAYFDIFEQAYIAIQQFQKRANNGKIISKFGERIHLLLQDTLNDFRKRVAGTLYLPERLDKTQDLKNFILTAAKKLFEEQIQTLEYEYIQKFKKQLVKLHRATDADTIPVDVIQQVTRKVSFDYKTAVNELELDTPTFQLQLSTEGITGFTSKLAEIATAYPESNEAKLELMRKFDKKVQKAPSKKKRGKKAGGQRSVGVSLNLVGMLRPPGYGTLQGFIGYATSLLGTGIPLDLLLGFQNDGDLPEILGDDREHPLLRLQPKFNFDIEL